MIGLAKEHGGLYYLIHPDTGVLSNSCSFSHSICQFIMPLASLWHFRLGHPSLSRGKATKAAIPCFD